MLPGRAWADGRWKGATRGCGGAGGRWRGVRAEGWTGWAGRWKGGREGRRAVDGIWRGRDTGCSLSLLLGHAGSVLSPRARQSFSFAQLKSSGVNKDPARHCLLHAHDNSVDTQQRCTLAAEHFLAHAKCGLTLISLISIKEGCFLFSFYWHQVVRQTLFATNGP